MKLLFLSAALVVVQHVSALQIQHVIVSAVSSNTINISLNTEATGLYYFSSWQHTVVGNSIVVEVCFIHGFGSTIASLNNNFQIPLNTTTPSTYFLTVKIYYCNSAMYDPRKLQDQILGTFKWPLREKAIFKRWHQLLFDAIEPK